MGSQSRVKKILSLRQKRADHCGVEKVEHATCFARVGVVLSVTRSGLVSVGAVAVVLPFLLLAVVLVSPSAFHLQREAGGKK